MAGQWTEAEKTHLLASILDTHAPKIDWQKVDIPQGRTIKACTHVLAQLRKSARDFAEQAQSTETEKKVAVPRRRRAAAPGKVKVEDKDGEVDAEKEARDARDGSGNGSENGIGMTPGWEEEGYTPHPMESPKKKAKRGAKAGGAFKSVNEVGMGIDADDDDCA